MPDPIEGWNKAKILALAKTTGKSLEVECALKFIEANRGIIEPDSSQLGPREILKPWKVELGSYYTDDASGKTRELDVLATRTKLLTTMRVREIHTFIKVAVSCKGFAQDSGPTTFSLDGARLDIQPELMFGESNSHGFPNEFAREAAKMLLTAVDLRSDGRNQPMIVGYNIFEEFEKGGATEYKRDREREKDLYEHGMDSAVKAAIGWRKLLFPNHKKSAGAFIPIMVTDKPWWQFPVDTGDATDPALKKRGFLVNSYPIQAGKGPLDLMSLMCSKDQLPEVITKLATFGDWFAEEAKQFFRGD